jgi:tripartite-type tricarboxylate transporter receptor subunit TctC
VAPAKTPEPVLARLATEIAAVMADPEVKKTLAEAGLEATMLRSDAFQQLIRKEITEFKAVAQRSNITLD